MKMPSPGAVRLIGHTAGGGLLYACWSKSLTRRGEEARLRKSIDLIFFEIKLAPRYIYILLLGPFVAENRQNRSKLYGIQNLNVSYNHFDTMSFRGTKYA